MTELSELVVPARYNGPATSGNGGIVAGLLAQRLGAGTPVTVTLRRPPPLGEAMRLSLEAATLTAADSGGVVATAVASTEPAPVPVIAPDAATARDAALRYDGLSGHPFGTCFVCGPSRPEQDGLAVFAGAVVPGEPRRVAGTFTNRPGHGLDPDVLVWAVLDCPGGWAIGLVGRHAVLGRMTAQVFGAPAEGETCVVVAECDRWDGRKAFSRSSLYSSSGALLGVAGQVWIELRDWQD